MYLNPPCNDVQEFKQRLANGDIFKVFNRRVNERNRDKTFKRFGRSTVTLGDGTEVVVVIFSGKVQMVESSTSTSISTEPTTPFVPPVTTTPPAVKELNYMEFLKNMSEKEVFPPKQLPPKQLSTNSPSEWGTSNFIKPEYHKEFPNERS